MDEKSGPQARSEWSGSERADGLMHLFSVKRTSTVDGLEARSVCSGREE